MVKSRKRALIHVVALGRLGDCVLHPGFCCTDMSFQIVKTRGTGNMYSEAMLVKRWLNIISTLARGPVGDRYEKIAVVWGIVSTHPKMFINQTRSWNLLLRRLLANETHAK